jgi:hypothetical protein
VVDTLSCEESAVILRAFARMKRFAAPRLTDFEQSGSEKPRDARLT